MATATKKQPKKEKPAPERILPREQSLRVASHTRNRGTNTGIICADGWRGTWVSLRSINDAILMGIEVPTAGDARILNPEAFQKHELPGGKVCLGRADTLIGLVSDAQYAQYLQDHRSEMLQSLAAEGGTLKMTQVSAQQYEEETVGAAEGKAQSLTPPTPTAK